MTDLDWLRLHIVLALGCALPGCVDSDAVDDGDRGKSTVDLALETIPSCGDVKYYPPGVPVVRCVTAKELQTTASFPVVQDVCRGSSGESSAHLSGPFPPEGCPPLQNSYPHAGTAYSAGNGYLIEGACCYRYCLTGYCGRPLTIGDQSRVASLTGGEHWRPDGFRDSLAVRHAAALAQAWRHDALEEHAAVASFGRFVLELLAFGAPPELVRDAAVAVQDEIRHTQTCLAIAQQLDGTAQGPGPLALHDLTLAPDLAAAAAAAVAEGCVGETLAAAHAAAAGQRAAHADIATALADIANEEAAHAALAWRFVAWALKQGDARVAQAVAAAFDAALAAVPAPRAADAALDHLEASELYAAGRLPVAEATALYLAVLHQVIDPGWQALRGGEVLA